ncbi:MAG TPA: dienelactone hydrolase family protein [Mucilaginibacter sp.]|jgi:hypothetical protein
MSKNLYIFLNIFLGLAAASVLWQGIIRFQLGAEMITLDSFVAWFLTVIITHAIGSVLLLKYYYYRKYWSAFYTAIIATIANLCFYAIFYVALVSRELTNYYMPAQVVSLCAGIVYAVSLIFSVTGKKFWLKLAGFFMLVIGLVLVSTIIWYMSSKTIRVSNISEKIAQWTSLAAGLIPVLLIMHFRGELKELKTENVDKPAPKLLESIFGFVAISALLFTITFGVLITSESYSKLYWKIFNAEKAQQLVKLSGVRSFTGSKGGTLRYLLIKPLNYNPQKKYPLVVSLPYGGYEASAAEFLSTDAYRKEYPAFLFVPYCPDGAGWGGIPNYPTIDTLVYDAISSLDKEPGIDVKRRYITGLSRGGYGTWHFICARPDMFAAAVPVAGGGDPKLAASIINVPVWAFHGRLDKNVPVSGSRDMIAAIKKAGGNPRYTEYPDEGHNIWEQASITPGLWDWVFAQKRE